MILNYAEVNSPNLPHLAEAVRFSREVGLRSFDELMARFISGQQEDLLGITVDRVHTDVAPTGLVSFEFNLLLNYAPGAGSLTGFVLFDDVHSADWPYLLDLAVTLDDHDRAALSGNRQQVERFMIDLHQTIMRLH